MRIRYKPILLTLFACYAFWLGFNVSKLVYLHEAQSVEDYYLHFLGQKTKEIRQISARIDRLHNFFRENKAIQFGVASWYGHPFHGRLTANGEVYDMHGMTVASPDLPLGSEVFIFNLATRKSTFALVNDRGPYIDGRIIDVSLGVAQELGMVEAGISPVMILRLEEEK